MTLRTPKSPQPGHQSGATSALKLLTSSLRAVAVKVVILKTPCLGFARRSGGHQPLFFAAEDDAQMPRIFLGWEAAQAVAGARFGRTPNEMIAVQFVDNQRRFAAMLRRPLADGHVHHARFAGGIEGESTEINV